MKHTKPSKTAHNCLYYEPLMQSCEIWGDLRCKCSDYVIVRIDLNHSHRQKAAIGPSNPLPD